jgi:alanyl-tRNA synthetase
MADTGPCGPCSEIHFDRGAEFSEGEGCVPDHSEHCPRWLEVWNLVFMQFDRSADGTLTPLPFQSVDTGMGLERIASAVQGVDSNYRTDLFVPIIERLAEYLGHDPETVESERFSYQVVADHSRAMTFMIGEGITPANEAAGYVLRRIMRRAVRHGRLLGISRPFLRETCAVVIDLMGSAYPYLAEGRDRILEAVAAEEAAFARTLEAGSERLRQLLEAAGAGGTLSGADAFKLHDTFGFPIDLTIEVAREAGIDVDRGGFDVAMREQRERSRTTRQQSFTVDAVIVGESVVVEQTRTGESSTFIGYPNETQASELRVIGLGGHPPENFVLALDRTPFYPEGGGQVGDRGVIVGPKGTLGVDATHRLQERIWHGGRLDGSFELGDLVSAQVDEAARFGAARNHTATHLLHRALRDVLGPQAKQAGSWVGPDALRFDFPASSATPREALRDVERRVNEQIRRNAEVRPVQMTIEQARDLGADMFFGEKYAPESVRVVQVDGFSKELCGGTHVAATGQIGSFRILGESSIGAGLRRIEAVTGEAAEELIQRRLQSLHDAAQLLGDRDDNVPVRVEALLARLKETEKATREGRGPSTATRLDAAATLGQAQLAGETRVMVERFAEADAAALRTLADDLRGLTGRFVLVAAGGSDGQPALLVAASRDLVGEGFDSAAIIRSSAPIIAGGGGGRPDLAQAGGRDASRLDDAQREAARLALDSLARIESS